MPGGRPTKLTHELIERLCIVLRTGAYLDTAFKHVGICKATHHSWAKAGNEELARRAKGAKPRKSRDLHVEFLNATEKAMADAELLSLGHISKAASDGQWAAAAWKLERRSPEKWGRRRVEVTGADGVPVAVR